MKKTILLVEDSKLQKLANEGILYNAGYLVLTAENGEDALRLAQESLPDLILLDLLLPGIGGEEVLQALKEHGHTSRIPVIVLSSVIQTNFATLKAAGAEDYFEKSRLVEDRAGEQALLDMIEGVLRNETRTQSAVWGRSY